MSNKKGYPSNFCWLDIFRTLTSVAFKLSRSSLASNIAVPAFKKEEKTFSCSELPPHARRVDRTVSFYLVHFLSTTLVFVLSSVPRLSCWSKPLFWLLVVILTQGYEMIEGQVPLLQWVQLLYLCHVATLDPVQCRLAALETTCEVNHITVLPSHSSHIVPTVTVRFFTNSSTQIKFHLSDNAASSVAYRSGGSVPVPLQTQTSNLGNSRWEDWEACPIATEVFIYRFRINCLSDLPQC